jgi:hypothetical protein
LTLSVLNFSPYAFINVHAYPESIVCKTLEGRGHSITQVRCKGIYKKNCISMSAAGISYNSSDEKKEQVCNSCKANSSTLKTVFGFATIYIDDYVTADEVSRIDQIIEDIDTENWTEFQYQDMPIGKYASYEFLLNRKISSINFDKELLLEYKAALSNALITLIASQKISQKFSPDRVISYNNLYSCNHIFGEIFKKNNSSTVFSLHAGSHHKYRLSEMTIFKDYIMQSLTNRSAAWYDFSKVALNSTQVNKAYEHIVELLEAKSPWVYSIKSTKKTSEEIRKQLYIPKSAKVLLAMMASGDERFAAAMIDALPPYETPFFRSQLEWIQHLIDLAKRRPDFYIIVRVHPREFPNKREKILSTQAKILRESFDSLPSNVIVNWPEDNISLHDLVKVVDVGLNATSTAGLELLMFGIPVVIYDEMQLFSYPREFNYVASCKSDYITQITRALADGFSLDHVINAFRWIAFRSNVVAIDISDVYRVSMPTRIINKLMKIIKLNITDPSLNKTAIISGVYCNAKLVCAIEKNISSHMEIFFCKDDVGDNSLEVNERILIKAMTRKYFKKIGLIRF